MIKQMDTYKEMRNITEQILYQGKRILFSPAEKYINLGLMFGFFNNENGRVVVSNRIFEFLVLYQQLFFLYYLIINTSFTSIKIAILLSFFTIV
jgi:hypothetical protein